MGTKKNNKTKQNKKNKKTNNILRSIDDLITINDGNEFENQYNEIYQPKLIF